MKKRVFVSKGVPQVGISLLEKEGYDVVVSASIKKKAKGVNALLCLLTDKIDGALMDSIGSQLKIVSNMAVGLDNIDVAEAKKRGVRVANTPGVLTQAVAEYTIALLLTVARRVVEGDRFVRQRKYKGWLPDLLLGVELQGKTLGIVGHGRIGCRVARILKNGFGMKVLYYDITGPLVHDMCGAKKVSLKELLRNSDVVSLHVPLLDSTHHLIGEKELRMMKKSSYLINTSRGAVIDEKILVKALNGGRIAGAALDVFEHEPKLTHGLTKLNNVVLTPHIGSASKEARNAMAELAAKNIIKVLKIHDQRSN